MPGSDHSPTETKLHPEVSPHRDNYDLESQMGAGAALGRQISIQLTPDQFEKLYLQPGGTAAKGDLAKRLGNPTPLGIASFLLCLTPFSAELMGWHGSTTDAAVISVGSYYWIGGVGLYLSGIMEWIIGNTFPFLVFTTFGGFWFAFGAILRPEEGIAAALGGSTAPQYNLGLALYLLFWGILVGVYLVASLRTNLVFVLLFTFLQITFDLLIALYFRLGSGNTNMSESYLKAAGAFAFLTCAMGWYLLFALTLGATGMPLSLPVGDMSGFMSRKKTQ